METLKKLLNILKNYFKNYFLGQPLIEEIDEESRQRRLVTGPSNENYFENFYNWWYPTDEFVARVQTQCALYIKKMKFEDLIDVNNLKQLCKPLKKHQLFKDTIEHYKEHFDKYNSDLIDNYFSFSMIKEYIKKRRLSKLKDLTDHIHSQFHYIHTIPITSLNFSIQHNENHYLIKHAIGNSIIHTFIDDYFNNVKSTDELKLYSENLHVWYRSLIKVLTHKLKLMDVDKAFELVSRALSDIECEQDQLKLEKGYYDTFDIWEFFLKKRQKLLKRSLSDGLINDIVTSKENLRLFEFNDYVKKHEQLGNIFNYLKDHKFIHANTNMSDFKAIFNNRFNNMIHWIGNKKELIYFIKLLMKYNVTVENNEYIKAVWNCFLYNDRNPDYKKESNTLKQISYKVTKAEPPKRALELDELIKFLI